MAKISNLPRGFEGEASYIRSISGGSHGAFYTQPAMTGLFYVFDQMEVWGKVYLTASYVGNIYARFTIGGVASTVSVGKSYNSGDWTDTLICNVIGTGWQTIDWQLDWGTAPSGTITATAHSMHQAETV